MSDSKECTRSGEGSAGAGGAGAGSESPAQPHLGKVIIDTDPGVDDSMALLCALASERIEIVGLTLCMGNHHDMGMYCRPPVLLCRAVHHLSAAQTCWHEMQASWSVLPARRAASLLSRASRSRSCVHTADTLG